MKFKVGNRVIMTIPPEDVDESRIAFADRMEKFIGVPMTIDWYSDYDMGVFTTKESAGECPTNNNKTKGWLWDEDWFRLCGNEVL